MEFKFATKSFGRPRPKINWVDTNGNPVSPPSLGILFDRSPQERARIESRRPGTFVVPKRDLLEAIIELDKEKIKVRRE